MLARKLPKRRFFLLGVVLTIGFLLWHLRRPRQWESPGRALADIHNGTLGYDKIFVVSLPSRSDRRDAMVLQAALSNIKIEFIDGVSGKDVPDKAIPLEKGGKRRPDASIGSWRAHMNAIREVVHRNLSSALILEDDIDWDVRIKDQLVDLALSTRALTQPLRGRRPHTYADPTFPMASPSSPDSIPDIPFTRLPATIPPTSNPYGDNWDLLWLGHCGMHFPFPYSSSSSTVPKARVIRLADPTVAPKPNLWNFNLPFILKEQYPPNTRAYHHVQQGVCSLAYAVSQRGAQKLLLEVGLKPVTEPFDLLLRAFCDGGGELGRKKAGRQCLTTQPGLFQHHRAVGPQNAMSDIGDHGAGWRGRAVTDMVRWSVRLNAEVLMEGGGEVVDQWPGEK